MGEGLKWAPGGGTKADDGKPYYSTSGKWTISRSRVGGVWRYTLFEVKRLLGVWDSAEDAAAEANKRERE